MLFGGDSSIDHEPGSGQVSFRRHKQDSSAVNWSNSSNKGPCTSLFIEPVSWMLPLLEGTIDGKVLMVYTQLNKHIACISWLLLCFGKIKCYVNCHSADSNLIHQLINL